MDASVVRMLVVMVALLVIPVVGYGLWVRDAVRVGRFLQRAACYGVVVIFGLIGVVMVLSTAAHGPVLSAVALTALWCVPPVAVALWCRRGARYLEPLLWAAVALICSTSIIAGLSATAWMDFANEQGPYFQVLVLMTGVCLAIWSLREPFRGGIAMIVIGLIPVLVLAAGPGTAVSSLATSISPVVVFAVAGLGCLAGRRLEQGRGRPVDADEALVVGVTGRDQGRVPDGHRDGDRTQG